MSVRLAAWCACLALLVACDENSPPPTPEPEPAPGTERISGNERIGWDQLAATAADLATFRYLVYVDTNAGAELRNLSCASTPGAAGFACSAGLPSMTPGAHTLRLSAFVDEGTRLESDRSAPLNVVVIGSATSPASTAGTILTTVDGVRLRAAVAAQGLDEPTDLAVAPDGRIFIAERKGRVRIVRDGHLVAQPAVTLRDAIAADRHGLLAIALDPDFERTKWIFAVYTAASGFRLARFRVEGDVMSERVILMDAIASSSAQPAATLRFGPDAKLYVGLDDGGDENAAGDLGSFSGKVLRLNADATTPSDQAGGTPVYALNVSRPRGVDWGSSGALWIGESRRLHVVASNAAGGRRASTVARYALPEDVEAAGLGFYRGDLIPALRGNLLIASGSGRAILRLQFDARDRDKVRSTELLLRDVFGPVRAIGVGPDGVIYFCTEEALVRLVPDVLVDRGSSPLPQR